MKWRALTDQSGAYELRVSDDELFGGIVIDGNNRGIGFVRDVTTNNYLFEFEDGLIHKTVRIFANNKNCPLGTVKLGFTDCGVLECNFGKYEWKSLMSSKTWTDSSHNVVMFLDLEGSVDRPISLLSAERLDPPTQELMALCGWYLTVVEYRADYSNSKLAGMPVKSEAFRKVAQQAREANSTQFGVDPSDWWDVLIDVIVD